MRITGGKLAEAFGEEAYLRIVPQANSTFHGEFTTDFSSEKPLTNLRAARERAAGDRPRAVDPDQLLDLRRQRDCVPSSPPSHPAAAARRGALRAADLPGDAASA